MIVKKNTYELIALWLLQLLVSVKISFVVEKLEINLMLKKDFCC
jgi:hypothetical protein